MTRDEKIIAFVREEFASLFDTLASDQHAMIRYERTKKGKRERDIRAEVFSGAAYALRDPANKVEFKD